jgi:hypothetical protein
MRTVFLYIIADIGLLELLMRRAWFLGDSFRTCFSKFRRRSSGVRLEVLCIDVCSLVAGYSPIPTTHRYDRSIEYEHDHASKRGNI